MKISLIIPARFKSSRFPGKPLVKIHGKELILHVLEKAENVFDKQNIYVATDDNRIHDLVQTNNFNSIMTSSSCLTGTDRVAEASMNIDSDIFINLQGDEPLVNPSDLKKAIQEKIKYPQCVINSYTEIGSNENIDDINIPKVVINEKEYLVYMSRSRVPGSKEQNKDFNYFKQVCIYAFNKYELNKFYRYNKKSLIEKKEDIEILRFLELGIKIKMFKASSASLAVDTPNDVLKVEKFIEIKNES